MANKWNIPDWLEKEIRSRDTACVYCGNEFTSVAVSRKSVASWEHYQRCQNHHAGKYCPLLLRLQCEQGAKASSCLAANQVLQRSWYHAGNRGSGGKTGPRMCIGGVALNKALKFVPGLAAVHRTSLTGRRLA